MSKKVQFNQILVDNISIGMSSKVATIAKQPKTTKNSTIEIDWWGKKK